MDDFEQSLGTMSNSEWAMELSEKHISAFEEPPDTISVNFNRSFQNKGHVKTTFDSVPRILGF